MRRVSLRYWSAHYGSNAEPKNIESKPNASNRQVRPPACPPDSSLLLLSSSTRHNRRFLQGLSLTLRFRCRARPGRSRMRLPFCICPTFASGPAASQSAFLLRSCHARNPYCPSCPPGVSTVRRTREGQVLRTPHHEFANRVGLVLRRLS